MNIIREVVEGGNLHKQNQVILKHLGYKELKEAFF